MQELLLHILNSLKNGETVDNDWLSRTFRAFDSKLKPDEQHFSKNSVLRSYFQIRETEPELWESWNVDEETERGFVTALRMKPRRTASGVATITVITKPWTCSNDCLYCPNDIRMPKSYLHDEPACQRAERNFFDPYLQVAERLRTLIHMGHITDKVELIVLGGTWSDYPESYQIWFMAEMFRAVNDGRAFDTTLLSRHIEEKITFYKNLGFTNNDEELAGQTLTLQQSVNRGELRFNAAVRQFYGNSECWKQVSQLQETLTLENLQALHKVNETAHHRVVGLVVETRPDLITDENLRKLRALGCTKVQIGIQSLSPEVLNANQRPMEIETLMRAFDLLRLHGFKIHSHFMVNLYTSNPAQDLEDYRRFVGPGPFQPDEIKLYPCALIGSSRLMQKYREGSWQPYSDEELIELLGECIRETPCFTRISRMIRDFSAASIEAGNKRGNLRQDVESTLDPKENVQEMRYREIAERDIEIDELKLDDFVYETRSTTEHFLQWVTPDDKLAGFLRLSLPKRQCPFETPGAMIREVHVYGKVSGIGGNQGSAQHTGLGKRLIAKAESIAQGAGFGLIRVISAVGTREYYRSLGFQQEGDYQSKPLDSEEKYN